MERNGGKGDATKLYRTKLRINFDHVFEEARNGKRIELNGIKGLQPNHIEQGCKVTLDI